LSFAVNCFTISSAPENALTADPLTSNIASLQDRIAGRQRPFANVIQLPLSLFFVNIRLHCFSVIAKESERAFMSSKRMAYTQARTELLERITRSLREDERFVAAWLAGSFGRGEQTWLSDLDLHVVVADAFSESLCGAPWPIGAKTTPERLALFGQFGTPGLIFERTAHANKIDGILTNVVYQESAQSVDWMLIPQAKAYREQPSLLLFEKAGLPEAPAQEPESPEQLLERASMNVGFFWIIACGSARALASGQTLLFYSYLLELERMLREVRAALRGERAQYKKYTDLHVSSTYEQQVAALRHLCDEMERLMPQVVQVGGYIQASPRAIIEMRLALSSEGQDALS
jgi:hypothetical protein